jgi:predicted outer membrane repeat protein
VERIFFISDGAAVTLDSLTIQNGRNTGATFDGRGAGINNQGSLTILNCSISGNTADGAGGGIHTAGSLTILDSSVSNNSGTDDGGGIWLFSGTLSVSDSTFDGNAAKNGGGAIAIFNGSASVTGSAFTNNTADSGRALRVFNSGTINVTNSTFSGNATTNTGGAIRNDTGSIYLNNVTVVRNRSSVHGGGLYGSIHLRNSIIAANTILNLQFFPGADCLVLFPDSLISEGYNLIQDSRNCNITGDTATNLLGVDAQLGGLSLNGGSTRGADPSASRRLPGGAAGSFLSGITITDSGFLNEFRQSFNPGGLLSFTLSLTTNADSGSTPDEFSVAILDRNGAELPTLSALLYGTSVILIADLTGDETRLMPFASDPHSPIAFAAPDLSAPAGSAVPEPGTWMLLASGIAGILLPGSRTRRPGSQSARRGNLKPPPISLS